MSHATNNAKETETMTTETPMQMPVLSFPNLGAMTYIQLQDFSDRLAVVQKIAAAMQRGIGAAQCGRREQSRREFDLVRALREQLPADLRVGITCHAR